MTKSRDDETTTILRAKHNKLAEKCSGGHREELVAALGDELPAPRDPPSAAWPWVPMAPACIASSSSRSPSSPTHVVRKSPSIPTQWVVD
ncbi:hypothetical protein L596_025461 [Steinernema carpocapsae]|uniref:Uncharacterized protein n=1 Tax=Steinernema carpocapsae TaxID=34508 RepID=A0A4U5M7T7_STECR|nr:hypothetical protein L596_025461 [Steinernema carpocapsae]